MHHPVPQALRRLRRALLFLIVALLLVWCGYVGVAHEISHP